ncbi:excinuclease ABC subunit UvrA [Mesoterricola silvestris]|uniref:UvrABC system protein A n=1 Tax=Mesoterricola silvestris TaxID=2927979 RepID=A0AA48GV00_9BACT|nr:excinuclease ABC subunit UvrA [Mesoterricola silvestris]BDU74880.1 UvrABC system protein A [Mesoterricola silvestris]
MDSITIKGAREHNLKNVDLVLPRNKLVVITGLSGSGKSSLAFDTLYAEGQRRYVESLSAYARQFLDQMEKPDVDSIEGLSPAISIEQKTTSRNPRSTVATVTEIYDYLRLLFARVGLPQCMACGRPIASQTIQEMADQILAQPQGMKIQVLAPVVRARKGEYKKLLADFMKRGYIRARVNGEMLDLTDGVPDLDKQKKHTIEVVIDRLKNAEGISSRLADSLEIACNLAEGSALVDLGGNERLFSSKLACNNVKCQRFGMGIPDLEPRSFSFNSPFGACPTCDGLGFKRQFAEELIVPNPDLSISQGCIVASGWKSAGEDGWRAQFLGQLSKALAFSLDTPWRKLSADVRRVLLYGLDRKMKFIYQNKGNRYEFMHNFEGVVGNLERRYRETSSEEIRAEMEESMRITPCEACGGTRLKPEILSVFVGGLHIAAVSAMSVRDARVWFDKLRLEGKDAVIAGKVFKEINERLGFLDDVGLGYLTLDRSAATLSGGEGQRIRLATQIGSKLQGVMYVLDEPSIGLHQRDNQKLLNTLKEMRDLGNTVLVVEHDLETILAADHVVDLGPGAGEHGGFVVAEGTPEEISRSAASVTGHFLSGKETIPVPRKRRKASRGHIQVVGAQENNLRKVDASFPIGLFTCVTGVSGSGKSTLVNEILYKALANQLHQGVHVVGRHRSIKGLEHVDKVIDIDQAPIGRTPRSNPATYTGLFTPLRDLFSQLPESKARGYTPGRFSFNVKGGRCEKCEGDGVLKIEMHFLPDIYVTCEQCKGKRYNRETLEIHYKGHSVSDVLAMTVEEALALFAPIPVLANKLQTLSDVGLGYIRLGQSATTLSGGEAQRVKLARELSKRPTGRTLYILDEPTTGLHLKDIQKLLEVIGRLMDAGNTVVVIEHNLDVIKTADHILDLGPEGGAEGGLIIATGTPEEVAKNKASVTGRYLRPYLKA